MYKALPFIQWCVPSLSFIRNDKSWSVFQAVTEQAVDVLPRGTRPVFQVQAAFTLMITYVPPQSLLQNICECRIVFESLN